MTLVQKFILFLGPPVYALSVVLFSILLFSGLGSFVSSHFREEKLQRNIQLICFVVAALILFYLSILPSFLYTFVRLPTYLKALLVVGLLVPLSFVMGMPMPLGIQWLRKSSPGMIPWAWGVNGSTSVLGSILTILIAVNFGFDQALLSACGLYLLAAFVVATKTAENPNHTKELISNRSELRANRGQ